MEFLKEISEIGTNAWMTGFLKNNSIILGILIVPIGAWLKGKHPEFWAKLSTMIPFVGEPKKRIG